MKNSKRKKSSQQLLNNIDNVKIYWKTINDEYVNLDIIKNLINIYKTQEQN
jgi:hypothetical protein